jgi:mono/diheme cytochrome c family protein
LSFDTGQQRGWQRFKWLWLPLWVACMAGCQPEMTDQPRYEPFEASTFFEDGRSARHLVPGTVARGQLMLDTPLATGRADGQMVDTLPLPVTRDLLERGQERYDIYCAPCHDRVGMGRGMIVRRGYPRPPSLHVPRLRQAPVGHFFEVITQGFGAQMPAYDWMIPPPDRWAIIAYIRALQLSQHATLAAVPEAERRQLQDTKP